ncbi:DegT/DnrJ/EryC1/StrS family aminotransferase [Neptunicella sp. SCSIO 80796]|uniref:DegT/DnrJ/EryC1/StrS family aminotransferase n=1 Tax=Neptunicella plasticusilytica TaxID=3117012 RepID=UPI003A4D89CC
MTNTIVNLAEPSFTGNEKSYLLDCIESGWISSQGQYVNRFEEQFSHFIGCNYAVATSNGTTALHLALMALGIGPGDEVLVPDLTFGATANAVIHCGAKPVLVDVNRQSWCMDAEQIESRITSQCKAMIVVHLYGRPASMKQLMALAEKYDLFVVEDCAESIGARFDGQMTGAIGHIGCFSFFANKILSCGEGGMVTTDDPALDEKIRLLRDHGMDKEKRYWHLLPGYNYRLTNMQAAVGLAQLEQVDEFLVKRQQINHFYRSQLADLPEVQLHQPEPDCEESTWLFSLLVSAEVGARGREILIDCLNEKGIQARRFFYPLHQQPAYQQQADFTNSVTLSEHGVCLPTYTQIKPEQLDYVVETVRSCMEKI